MVCQYCGTHAPTKYVALYSNIGMLFLRHQQEIKGNLCRVCINDCFWKFTLINLLLGWWGIISFFSTIFFLLNNAIHYIGARDLQALPQDANGSVHPRPAWVLTRGLVVLALILLGLCAVLVAVAREATRPVPMSAAEVQATAQALAAVTAPAQVQTRVVAYATAVSRVHGPSTNQIEHQKDDKLELSSAILRHRNFIAQVRFYNPDVPADPGWSYGFVFRSGSYEDYRLYVTSEGYWAFDLASGVGFNPTFKELAVGELPDLVLSTTGSNHLRLMVSGNEALFFVNGKYVDTLDVSENTDSGYINLGIEFLVGHEADGTATRYEDFTVWELP